MSCSVLTAERLAAMRDQRLPPAERQRLLAHLGGDCEECLATLTALGDDETLELLAGPAARLAPAEADAMFAAAQRASGPALHPAAPAPAERLRALWQRLWQRPGLLVSAAALAALVLVALPRARPVGDGIKGEEAGAPPEIGLSAFVVELRDGQRQVLGPLHPGERLRRGQLLVFRYRLSAAAHVALVAESEGRRTLLWEPDPGDPPTPRGERELQGHGEALGLDPALLGQSVALTAIASARPLAGLAGLPSLSAEALGRACGGCAVGLDRLSFERER